jgi:non-haem Fe2+, alpha-ketoglutarate-dependent halogenase
MLAAETSGAKEASMPKILTSEQVTRYERDGFLFPIDACSRAEAAELARKVSAMEARLGHELPKRFVLKAHLPFPWLCDLVRNERLLDAVEDIIGPNILCWGTTFFSKQANDKRYISWHNDTFFYTVQPADTLSAWVGFHDSTLESGCVKYIPGSHRGPPPEHDFLPHPNNMAPDGRTVRGVDESEAVAAVLQAGQAVFHHESVVHGSGPNNARHARVGFVIHYIAPHVREAGFAGASAMLCRGQDTHGFWQIEPTPRYDLDPVCIEAMDRTRALFFEANKQKVAAIEAARRTAASS